jgi:hypothetical protein
MKSIFVITFSDAISIIVLAVLALCILIITLRRAYLQWRCKHVELEPPATSFGNSGHGWRCKKCMQDFGWVKP